MDFDGPLFDELVQPFSNRLCCFATDQIKVVLLATFEQVMAFFQDKVCQRFPPRWGIIEALPRIIDWFKTYKDHRYCLLFG
jgi:hypothetical protein